MHLSKIILKNNKKFLYSLITKDFFDVEFFELLFEIDSTQKNDFIFLYKSQMVLNNNAFVWFLENLNITSFEFFQYHLRKLIFFNIDIHLPPKPNHHLEVKYNLRSNFFNLFNVLSYKHLSFIKSDTFLKYAQIDLQILRQLLFIYSTDNNLPLKFFNLYKNLLRVLCKLDLSALQLNDFTLTSHLHHPFFIYIKYNSPKFSLNECFKKFCSNGNPKYISRFFQYDIDYSYNNEAPLKAAALYNSNSLILKHLFEKNSDISHENFSIIDQLYFNNHKQLPFDVNQDIMDTIIFELIKKHNYIISKFLDNPLYLDTFRTRLRYFYYSQTEFNFSQTEKSKIIKKI